MPENFSEIRDHFRIPDRFLRSVQLERDFHDVASLENYVVTPHTAGAFQRVADGLRTNSGRRAWRVTGDYGVGKSSFALVLAHLLQDRSSTAVSRIADAIKWAVDDAETPSLIPLLVTGSQEGIVPALARGIGENLHRRKPAGRKMPSNLARLIHQAREVEADSDSVGLERLLDAVRSYADGAGVLLIVDELGKLLEHASLRHDGDDVFVLQRLAEMAARSGDRPFILLGMLHQGFHAYAERLPSAVRHEWDKVAGRFEEIVFDQPLTHTAELVAGALNVDPKKLPKAIQKAARDLVSAVAGTGWIGGNATTAAGLDVARLYPLHPMLLPVAVRFFARFGQHERSLFGFLLSSEPFGVQEFARRSVAADAWYGLAEFYDYVRTVFGHRLAGASHRNHWLRIVAMIDGVDDLGPLQERILKTVAILNLLDVEDLLPTDRAIAASFAQESGQEIDAAIGVLVDRCLLYRRGGANAYRLWPSSSLSLDTAFETALRTVGSIENVANAIKPFLDHAPVVARRHYVENGTFRYFEVSYADTDAMVRTVQKETEADGRLVVALSDTEAERQKAIRIAKAPQFRERPDVLVAVVRPLAGLGPDLQDAMCWQWVAENTPELAHDSFASGEVTRQLALSRRTLSERLSEISGLRTGAAADVVWLRAGRREQSPSRGGLSALISGICDKLYPEAPKIKNELLNRNTLSSAAAAARMRLIEGLIKFSDQPYLGITLDKSPPEKSMYLSIIKKGELHVEDGGSFRVVEPQWADPLRLRPVLSHIIDQIVEAGGKRLPICSLLSSLKDRPYGVRNGLGPLFLAIILQTRGYELAIYENGTFLHKFGASDFLRLTKAPATFEIQYCKVDGVRLEVFKQLAASFSRKVNARQPDILDVVQPLCQFAAQLPEYTRRTTDLSKIALDVRNALLSAREPATLLFSDLPEACGFPALSSQEGLDRKRASKLVSAIRDALEELRQAYPALLSRIIERVVGSTGENPGVFDRARLTKRAEDVSLAANEPRLKTFALRLTDSGLSDSAWAEALASFIVSKPPSKWVAGDEARFSEEVAVLAEIFQKVEATTFGSEEGGVPSSALRLNLTWGDGRDEVRIIRPRDEDDTVIQKSLSGIEKRLPQDRHARLEVLSRLLWNELKAYDSHAKGDEADDSRNAKPEVK